MIMRKNIKFKEKKGKGKCEKCGVEITKDNWGRIDFVKGILLCRECLKKGKMA